MGYLCGYYGRQIGMFYRRTTRKPIQLRWLWRTEEGCWHSKKAVSEKVGNDCFEEDGNNRNKRFRYIGKDNDPLADMRNAKAINNLRQYWKFCQDSAGFFPKSWLEYFFKDCQDLLDMKAKRQKGEQVISASLDRILTNIEYLPSLYEAITNKMVWRLTTSLSMRKR